MRLEQFAMERMQSTYENQVAFNLSESGVHPLRLGELVDDGPARDALLAEPLKYIQSNGTFPLRSTIALLYPGATPDLGMVPHRRARSDVDVGVELRRGVDLRRRVDHADAPPGGLPPDDGEREYIGLRGVTELTEHLQGLVDPPVARHA
jgi:hypothetical protein